MISRQDSYLLFDVERGSGGDAGLGLFLLVQTVLSPPQLLPAACWLSFMLADFVGHRQTE